jgi:hypothetical protein
MYHTTNIVSYQPWLIWPKLVIGNSNYETYTITGLSGNVCLFLRTSASYGSDGAATYGGFYSGFTFKPQVTFNKITTTQI